MGIEQFLNEIRQEFKLMYSEKTFNDNITIEEMKTFIHRNRAKEKRFLKLLTPNIYMNAIYELLGEYGAMSMSYLIAEFIFIYGDEFDTEPTEDQVRMGLRRELKILENLHLVRLEALTYTQPKQVQLFRAFFATPEQLKDAEDKYKIFEKGFYERQTKHVEYKHIRDPSKQKKEDITGADILKGAAVKAAKKKADHIMKEVSSELYHCCGISLKNQEQLNAHWKSKYIIYRENQQLPYQSKGLFQDGDKICRECWSAYDSCEHNCEAKYYADKRKLQQQLTNILQTPTTLQLEGEK